MKTVRVILDELLRLRIEEAVRERRIYSRLRRRRGPELPPPRTFRTLK
jgi:hypothetical protein